MNSTTTEAGPPWSPSDLALEDELEIHLEDLDDDASYSYDGSLLTPFLYALHCAIVPIALVLYVWILFVWLWWRKHFTNPFYKLALGLGVCNIYNLLWLCYVFAYTYLQRSPFDARFDAPLAASSWVLWFANLAFQVVIATNRLLAIVCSPSVYGRLFTPMATLICIFACYTTSGIVFAPLFGAHPVAFNLSEGIDRFVDSDDQFSTVWEWVDAMFSGILLIYIASCYLATLCFVRKKYRSVANKMALMNEIKLAAASAIMVLVLIALHVVDYLRFDYVIVRTLECSYYGIAPVVYLLLDRKLRRHMLWCQCVRSRLYFNQNGAFETLTVSGRQMSGRVNKKYRRMPNAVNSGSSAENSTSVNEQQQYLYRSSRAVSGV